MCQPLYKTKLACLEGRRAKTFSGFGNWDFTGSANDDNFKTQFNDRPSKTTFFVLRPQNANTPTPNGIYFTLEAFVFDGVSWNSQIEPPKKTFFCANAQIHIFAPTNSQEERLHFRVPNPHCAHQCDKRLKHNVLLVFFEAKQIR